MAAIARCQRVPTSTISRWVARAAWHTRAWEQEHLAVQRPVELQLDELRSYGAAREARSWVYNALEICTRLWLGSRVGTCTLRNTLLLARVVRSRCRSVAAPILVTTDEFQYSQPCLHQTIGPACVYV